MKIDIDRIAAELADWAVDQVRLRNIVRRPFAIIDGKVRPPEDVIYHCPEAMR